MGSNYTTRANTGDASSSNKQQRMDFNGLLSSLGLTALLFLFYLVVFSALRKRLRIIYEPRTFGVADLDLKEPASDGLLAWIPVIFKLREGDVLHASGLDAYFFLRYAALVTRVCFILMFPLLLILVPIHFSGKQQGVYGMDRLSTLSLSSKQAPLYTVHLSVCILCTGCIVLYFKFELKRYFKIRAHYLLSQGTTSASASTLLLSGVSCDTTSDSDILEQFAGLSALSDGTCCAVRKIWFNRDYSRLNKLVSRRKTLVNKLEKLELWLIERCLGVGASPENHNVLNECAESAITGNIWRKYLPADCLQMMHGSKGIQLAWLKSEINQLNMEISRMQSHPELFPQSSSCFIQFNNSITAFIASRALFTGLKTLSTSNIFDRVYPADIIWSNLNTPSWTQHLISVGATLVNFTFVFGWAVPVAVISVMSQTEVMSRWLPGVHLMLQTPRVPRLMASVLTPIMAAAITSMIPWLFRILAQLKGFPTYTRVEMDVQKYLFLFMFFQLFLIVTLSSGLPSLMLTTIVNTSEGAIVLANSLPKATTFFMSYLVANCLAIAGNTLAQTQQLFWYYWYHLKAKTPRQLFKNQMRYSTVYWGSTFPIVTHVGVIALAYALINPLILMPAILGLTMIYAAFKYRLVYCYVPKSAADGDFYPKAILQLYAGVYCQQVSLLGSLLVTLQLVPSVIATLLIVGTMISQHQLQRLFHDMNTRIPLHRPFGRETEDESKSRASGSNNVVPENLELSKYYGNNILSQKSHTSNSWETISLNEPSPASVLSSAHTLAESLTPSFPASPESRSGILCDLTNAEGTISTLHANQLRLDMLSCDFENLSKEQKQRINSSMFDNPDLRQKRPCIWLPKDKKGVAQDQVAEMRHGFTDLRCSCSGSEINSEGKITITHAPADFDLLDAMRL